MTTSLAFCANTGVCLPDLPRTEPLMSLPSAAPDPDTGYLADFLVRNNGFIRG
jgi:hypothetical protein